MPPNGLRLSCRPPVNPPSIARRPPAGKPARASAEKGLGGRPTAAAAAGPGVAGGQLQPRVGQQPASWLAARLCLGGPAAPRSITTFETRLQERVEARHPRRSRGEWRATEGRPQPPARPRRAPSCRRQEEPCVTEPRHAEERYDFSLGLFEKMSALSAQLIMTCEASSDPCGILQPNCRPGGAPGGEDLLVGREVASLGLGRRAAETRRASQPMSRGRSSLIEFRRPAAYFRRQRALLLSSGGASWRWGTRNPRRSDGSIREPDAAGGDGREPLASLGRSGPRPERSGGRPVLEGGPSRPTRLRAPWLR